jgi:hypothetical protein
VSSPDQTPRCGRNDTSAEKRSAGVDNHCRIPGIDVGSVSLSVAEIGLKREISKTAYRFHHGDVRGALRDALRDFDLGVVCGVAAISSTPSILKASRIEKRTGVPVVSITYDGTSGNKNEAIVPYLAHLNRERE